MMIMSSCHICFLYLIIMILIITSSSNHGMQPGTSDVLLQSYDRNENQSTTIRQPYSSHRKLIHGSCNVRDISISQSRDYTAGIPQYIVQIVSTCTVPSCAPSNIHLHCGWFASARMINPRTFKRLSYDDCLVNGGKPLKTSEIIRFTYSNSFMYSLAFKSAKFC